ELLALLLDLRDEQVGDGAEDRQRQRLARRELVTELRERAEHASRALAIDDHRAERGAVDAHDDVEAASDEALAGERLDDGGEVGDLVRTAYADVEEAMVDRADFYGEPAGGALGSRAIIGAERRLADAESRHAAHRSI